MNQSIIMHHASLICQEIKIYELSCNNFLSQRDLLTPVMLLYSLLRKRPLPMPGRGVACGILALDGLLYEYCTWTLESLILI